MDSSIAPMLLACCLDMLEGQGRDVVAVFIMQLAVSVGKVEKDEIALKAS